MAYIAQWDYKTQTYHFVPAYTEAQKPLEEQIETLQKEIDKLRQELTVIKTLLPGPCYRYYVSNASEGG